MLQGPGTAVLFEGHNAWDSAEATQAVVDGDSKKKKKSKKSKKSKDQELE